MKRSLQHFALAAAIASAGCASGRKDVGEVQVRTLRPAVSAQRFDYVNFRVQEGRVFVSSPFTGTDFDLVAMDDGCLRGSAGTTQLHFCPAAPKPDADGTRHWRSVGGGRTFFSTLLRDDGKILEIEAANFRAELELGNTATDDEIRKHPELIAAAFARGLFPASKDEEGSDAVHREWKYVVKPL